MADQKKPESHAAFFIVMGALAVAIIGGAFWWFGTNSTAVDQDTTAKMNLPTHPPKETAKKPADATPSASAAPATAPAENK